MDVFQLYRPFRNQIARCELIDTLQFIWGFSRNLTFDLEVPDDIELPVGYRRFGDHHERAYSGIVDFELEFILKVCLAESTLIPSKVSLKRLKYSSKAINYLRKTLDDELSKIAAGDEFMIEFHRMVHRQFMWQEGYNKSQLFRAYWLYSHSMMLPLFESKFGMHPLSMTIISFAYFNQAGKTFYFDTWQSSEVARIQRAEIVTFSKHFTSDLDDVRSDIKGSMTMDSQLFYSFNPLSLKPLIKHHNGQLICPIPLFLYWRTTKGLYYDLVGNANFNTAFGRAFEDYVGAAITKAFSRSKEHQLSFFPELSYGNPEKKTSDWIICDQKTTMLIECKTKRLTLASKTELDPDAERGLTSDLLLMAGFVVQAYKMLVDYISGKVPQLVYQDEKIHVVVLTLEEWFIELNPYLFARLEAIIQEKFLANNLDIFLLERFPFHIFCVERFEAHLQLIAAEGMEKFFELLTNKELVDYDFAYQTLFEDEFRELIRTAVPGMNV